MIWCNYFFLRSKAIFLWWNYVLSFIFFSRKKEVQVPKNEARQIEREEKSCSQSWWQSLPNVRCVLVVLDRVTQNSKTGWVSALKTQTGLNSSSKIWIFNKVKLRKTWYTCITQSKTQKTRYEFKIQLEKIVNFWTWYMFELNISKPDETQTLW